MRSLFSQFELDRTDSTDNPFSVVYYAGHGASNRGNMYIFGVDAQFDGSTELKRLSISPGYEIFGDQAINVTKEMSKINNISGEGNLVFIDACRDNPVLDAYQDRINEIIESGAPKLTRDQIDRLSLKYSAADNDDYDDMFGNIIVTYSTPPMKPAADGGADASTRFASEVLALLRDPGMQKVNANVFAGELISRIKRRENAKKPYERQYAKLQGSIPFAPVFCFKDCPQPISAWISEKVEIFSTDGASDTNTQEQLGEPPQHGNLIGQPPPRGQFAVQQRENEPIRSRFPVWFVAAKGLGEPKFAQATVKPREDQKPATPSITMSTTGADEISKTAPGTNPVKVDIFYCIGDALEGEREASAKQVAGSISSKSKAITLANGYLGLVRIRSLSPEMNRKNHFVSGGNSIWVDRGDDTEASWAEFIKQSSTIDLKIANVDAARGSKNYISVFMCEGGGNIIPKNLVTTQVPLFSDTRNANVMVDALHERFTDLKFLGEIGYVDSKKKQKSPATTEVRYFLKNQTSDAQKLADELTSSLGHNVKTVIVPKFARLVANNPVIEIWVGHDDVDTMRSVYSVDAPAVDKQVPSPSNE
jgi:hypothetical protein